VNQALVVKTAVETECRAKFFRVSDKRWYSETTAAHIREIEDYGHENERLLPEGEGAGYLWKMESITRFEERDAGVYFELEAIALSRDVPASLRFIVEPIVMRISRSSVAESLKQTGQAVSQRLASNAESARAVAQNGQRSRTSPSAALGMAIINP
jgi:hypothetical protein